jgi:gliding motility-associated-like protein
MNKRVLNIIFLVFFVLLLEVVHAQQLKITNVTVINEQGHVRVNWSYNGTDNVEISRDNLATFNLTVISPTIPSGTHSFIDVTANAHKQPRSYKVKSIVNPVDLASKVVSTFLLTSKYDSCAHEIVLKWNDLETEYFNANEWTPSGFTIHANTDGKVNSYFVDASTIEYTIHDITENTTNVFNIETHWKTENTDSTSSSNPIIKFTEMPESPDYIKAISASIDDSNTNLKFNIASNSELENYTLFKSDAFDGNYYEIQTITSIDTIITTTDYESEPESKISYYKIVSTDVCNNETTESEIINNIVLELENEEFVNTLNWNSFKKQDFISTEYGIHRSSGDTDPIMINSIPNYTSNKDDIGKLQGEKLSGKFCYFIRATKENELEENYSQSNIVCVYLNPKIFIPEAFTPNDDGINDIFNAVFTFLPTDYELKIYNRWGNLVYHTKDPEKGWNGKQSNGNPAPTGTYIYFLKIKNPESGTLEKKGNITVLYP